MILILQLELAFAPQIIAMMIYLTTIIKLGVITSCCTLFSKNSRLLKMIRLGLIEYKVCWQALVIVYLKS